MHILLSIKAKRKPALNKDTKFKTNDLQTAYLAASLAEEKKGENILILDISRLSVISDYFIIVTAKSFPQIQAIAKYIAEEFSKNNQKLISKEGVTSNSWVVLDFGNIVVHIMTDKERKYYKLEQFWSNARFLDRKTCKKAS